MNKENTQRLVAAFPGLYRYCGMTNAQREKFHQEGHGAYRMQWGFECRDGWFKLIWDLSEAITDYARPRGIEVVAHQVKEKFGSLRFYVGIQGVKEECDHIYAMIDAAEAASATACEFCGKAGELRPGGWWHVACDPCEAKYQAGGFR